MSNAKMLRRQWIQGEDGTNHESLVEVENLAKMLDSPLKDCGILYRGQEALYPNWGNRSFSTDYGVASRFSDQYGGGVIYVTSAKGIDVALWHEEDALKFQKEREVIVTLEVMSQIKWHYYNVVLNEYWSYGVCIDADLSLKEVYADFKKQGVKGDPNELEKNILGLKNPKTIYPAVPIPTPIPEIEDWEKDILMKISNLF